MTSFKIYLRPHCLKWILYRLDQLGESTDVSVDPFISQLMRIFLTNGKTDERDIPAHYKCLKLKISGRYLMPGVDARKSLTLSAKATEEINKFIDQHMNDELFYMAEVYSRTTSTVQKAIGDFIFKYDLDENDITHDALDKRIKRAMEAGTIDVIRRKKHFKNSYSNILRKDNTRGDDE